MLADFDDDVTGVLESTKLATGRGEGHRGQDIVEVNGSEGTIVYSTQKPLELQIGPERRCGPQADRRAEGIPRLARLPATPRRAIRW